MIESNYWNLKDIREHLGCGNNKASYIRQVAIKRCNGACGWNSKKVKKQAVLDAIKLLDKEL